MIRQNRRSFLKMAGVGAAAPAVMGSAFSILHADVPRSETDRASTVITAVELYTVKVNARGDWHFLEIKTKNGLTGIGECSHAFAKTQTDGAAALAREVKHFFTLLKDRSPFQIEQFRQRAIPQALNKLQRTVFSGLEQALWDLCGKSLGVPTYDLLGGKTRDQIRVYANINRATNERDAMGRRPLSSFQKNAEQAMRQGFTAVKLAPFDEMRPLATATPDQVSADIEYAVGCIEGVRSTIGSKVDLLIDVHSHLNTELAVQTAKKIDDASLYWFEEPVDPQKFPAETKEIRGRIKQVLAGGESVFGREGYRELLQTNALGIIMPDVKHCGGLLEARFIAAMAESFGNTRIAPHNPSGPVATAASVSLCSVVPNFAILEYAFGEVPWSGALVTPAEQFKDGLIPVPEGPGLGISLNHTEIKKHQ